MGALSGGCLPRPAPAIALICPLPHAHAHAVLTACGRYAGGRLSDRKQTFTNCAIREMNKNFWLNKLTMKNKKTVSTLVSCIDPGNIHTGRYGPAHQTRT